MWMSEARWAMASEIKELISRTSVLSDSLTTSPVSASLSVGALASVLANSCALARAVGAVGLFSAVDVTDVVDVVVCVGPEGCTA